MTQQGVLDQEKKKIAPRDIIRAIDEILIGTAD